MTWAELERQIKKAGWKLDHHGKEHDHYTHTDFPYYIPIGRYESQEVATGTCKKS